MWFLYGHLRQEQLELSGTAALHGQAEDDNVHGTLCLPLHEGVSGAVHAAPSARVASSSVRCDGRRAATGICLLSEYKGSKTRDCSRHDSRRDRSLLRSLRIVAVVYGKRSREGCPA